MTRPKKERDRFETAIAENSIEVGKERGQRNHTGNHTQRGALLEPNPRER